MRRTAVVGALCLSLVLAAGCRSAKPQMAASTPAAKADQGAFTGTVAETMNAGGYTYMRLQSPGQDDTWAAAQEFETRVGDRLSLTLEMPMVNFESKTLGRTFPVVYFVSSVSRDGQVVSGAPAGVTATNGSAPPSMMAGHGSASAPTTVESVAPAPGGLSIADIWKQRQALSGKEVTVRGQVVKANNQILGKNWIHLQDGSGSATERTNDLTLTTDDFVKVGDVVTLKGVLAIGRDIGGGYAYDVIVENARVVR